MLSIDSERVGDANSPAPIGENMTKRPAAATFGVPWFEVHPLPPGIDILRIGVPFSSFDGEEDAARF